MESRWYVANWKMYLTYEQERDFFSKYAFELHKAASEKKQVIICPSVLNLASLFNTYQTESFMLGAQDCSAESSGAFTSQISAQSLAQAGAQVVILGHSERRAYLGETDAIIAKKLSRAWQAGLKPILCVGESEEIYKKKETLAWIEKQLLVLEDALLECDKEDQEFFCALAYEPLFSIGTGILPTVEHIETVLTHIQMWCEKKYGEKLQVRTLYGGSVASSNVASLKELSSVQGFLIGKSSINFAEFKKIIDT